eukprot:s2483_g2.t1
MMEEENEVEDEEHGENDEAEDENKSEHDTPMTVVLTVVFVMTATAIVLLPQTASKGTVRSQKHYKVYTDVPMAATRQKNNNNNNANAAKRTGQRTWARPTSSTHPTHC